uniref:Uncharacterized protein n=1 Tax=Panagrolaimus davidi TaxID=227884 RepID=A0A914QE48_9BILA
MYNLMKKNFKEGVLCELMEDVIESNNETLKLQADVHINNLRAACGYKTGTEFGKMLRSTAKAIIEGLQNIKNGNPGCFEKFEASKTDAKLKIKAFSNSRDILVGQNEGDSENSGGKNKLFESETLKAKRSEEFPLFTFFVEMS